MTLLITGLIFINLLFFALIGIGGASMASVEGIASPLIPAIFLFWICAHIPYGFYIVSLIKNKKSEKKLNATRRSISLSAWLAFPGGIALFMFIGSKLSWAAVVIPLIQTIIAISVYLRNK